MQSLVEKSSRLLEEMYDEKRGIFSFSAQRNGRDVVNDFDSPGYIRYTINTLAGIQRAKPHHELSWDFKRCLEAFLSSNQQSVTKLGDHGLLLKVLAEAGHDSAAERFKVLQAACRSKDTLLSLDCQELAWLMLGLTAYAERTGSDEARKTAAKVFQRFQRSFFSADTLLPLHNQSTWRRRFVSFGAIVYFLMSWYEYGRVFGDEYATTIFREGVRRIIDMQGPQGEWAWFYDTQKGIVVDWYQVYSVHQDSMAMLFLLPALDAGVEESRSAIRKSLDWLTGQNELGQPLMINDPFFIYRSIRRRGSWDRELRYLRSVGKSLTSRPAQLQRPQQLEINPECRSYHLGWILYAWAGREDLARFTAPLFEPATSPALP